MNAKTRLTRAVPSGSAVSPQERGNITQQMQSARTVALPSLSIIIPTLNEAQNIGELLRRLHETMTRHAIDYEAIVVDDHSSDDTVVAAERTIAALGAPAWVLLKRGKRGKTYSLIQGLDAAHYEALAILDGDLQYSPEALPDLLLQLRHADVVVGDRRASYETADMRRGRSSQVFNALVGRGLLSLDTDLQSGMKVFRREVYETALLRPGPWSFDLELLAAAQENGYRIASSPIEMQPRLGGQSKVRMARVGVELALRALAVRLHLSTHTADEDRAELAKIAAAKGRTVPFAPGEPEQQAQCYERWLTYEAMEASQARASGERERYAEDASIEVIRGKRRFQPFAPHQPEYSAINTFTWAQLITIAVIAVAWVAAIVTVGLAAVTVTLGVVTALYLFDLAVTMFISVRTLQQRAETPFDNRVVRGIHDEYWPKYTILCPLYHEAEVAAQFVNAMRLLDYPTDRLQVLLLTEEDDIATRKALLHMDLPEHFEVVTVPEGKPRTKPRACNYGLLLATGEFVVIYDAEDIPDPLQLKKAVLTFAHNGAELACVQASLNFYNPSQNLLTRWFTSEYSLWFDLTLPALQRMKSFLPLGGTSNHFRARILREVGGWDPFNVTEDCDLGVRLAQFHYRTAMVDSTTYEEANPNLLNWLRQRSRWVKGYMQTYFTHMRNPWRYVQEGRLGELFWLQVIVGGKPLAQLINPLLWLMLAVYIAFHQWVTPVYHILYPAPVFYAAAFCLVFGNFFYVYSYLIGCLNRRQYLLTLWSLLIPLYWLLMSVASYVALYQLLTRPHYWEKTNHGLFVDSRSQRNTELVEDQRRAGSGVGEALPRWTAPRARVALSLAHGVGRFGSWLVYPLTLSPLTRSAVEYVAHEAAMIRRELSRGGRQEAWLAPALALPVAPVVDSLSTVMIPSITASPPARRRIAKSTGVRETRYVSALRPLAAPVRTGLAPRQAPLRWLRDRWLLATMATAIAASVSAFLYYYNRGETMLYGDANAHMQLARMPFDAVTPGLAQLGSVWLPLPHILMWPLVWNDYLWHTGLAGSITDMLCFIVAAVFVFKIAQLVSGSGAAGYVGALAFILNPNVLYLQSTGLTEASLLAVFAATSYYFLLWTRTERIQHLLMTSACAVLATLTRYEGWSLFFALVLLTVVVGAFKRQSVRRIAGETLLFAVPSSFFIGLWLLWCYLLTGNPLYFQNGPYSAQAQQHLYLTQSRLPTFHNLPLDFITYAADVLEFAGPVLIALAVIGLGAYLRRTWKRTEGIAALALLAPLALYIVSLYSGQIVLYVPGISANIVSNSLFNVRYGASVMIPMAVFLAVSIGQKRLAQLAVIGLILVQSALTALGGVITVQDGIHGESCMVFTQTDIFLAEHYNSGRILVDTYRTDQAFNLLNIDLKNVVYIGSYKVWQASLADPAKYVDWVIVQPGDIVSQHLDVNSPRFKSEFILVQQDTSGSKVFYKRGLPPLPNRAAPTLLMQRYAQCNTASHIYNAQKTPGSQTQTPAPLAVVTHRPLNVTAERERTHFQEQYP